MLLLVGLGGWWLFGLAAVGAVLALHEYAGLVRPLRPLVLAAYVGVLAMLAAATVGGVTWLLGAILLTLAATFVLHMLAETRPPPTVAIGSTVLGAVWIGLGLSHVLLLRGLPERGMLAVFTVLLAVWASDTLAFFAGRLVGRHKLAPVMSPGKTWEGFAAGTVAALAVAFFALYEDRETFLSVWQALALGAVIALSGVLGDLFESALKREMHVKDTGRLLAAHGGVLDRIDSLLLAAPAAFYAILAFGHGP
ncbi:MAG: phosphatidate cytidylyltransferase [Thermoleophilia bacterium]|nr:phosphatidate cytidylyltransferase [Thermoleophilia bacterium]